MGKIRRGGYVFVTWLGDHGNHVHVYDDDRLITKWNLTLGTEEHGYPRASRRIRDIIEELRREGKLRYESKEGLS